MDRHRSLIATGVAGAIVAILCCVAPSLLVLFGAAGLSAWLTNADYVVLPVVLIGVGLQALAVTRKRRVQR